MGVAGDPHIVGVTGDRYIVGVTGDRDAVDVAGNFHAVRVVLKGHPVLMGADIAESMPMLVRSSQLRLAVVVHHVDAAGSCIRGGPAAPLGGGGSPAA